MVTEYIVNDSATATVLVKILQRKIEEVAERAEKMPITQLKQKSKMQNPPRGFIKAMEDKLSNGLPAVIAEIKKASPSKGVIRENFYPADIAASYEEAGASCISVLTDRDFFQGHESYLVEARAETDLPIIRKDFIIDEYQIYEARAIGADCILLIVAAFMHQPELLKTLHDLANNLGMDVLVEVHDAAELELALSLDLKMVGINNRNLHNFETSLDNTFNLLDKIPSDVLVVTESAIHCKEDVQSMQERSVNAFLVGEAFMRAENPGQALEELFF